MWISPKDEESQDILVKNPKKCLKRKKNPKRTYKRHVNDSKTCRTHLRHRKTRENTSKNAKKIEKSGGREGEEMWKNVEEKH